MTQAAAGGRGPRTGRASAERALLVLAYLVLAGLYTWQASRRAVPTIFSDELEMTQLSRSIAETGWPGRRGEALGFTTLAPWLTAPFWWIDDVGTAFSAIKTYQSFFMAAAIFPAYGIARFVASPPWAGLAAVGAAAGPALAYAPFLVTEPFAYPAAALALLAILHAVASPTRKSVLLAVAACVVGAATKSQLVMLVPVLAAGLGARIWFSAPVAARMRGWAERTLAAGALAVGAVVLWFALAAVSGDWDYASGELGDFRRALVWAAGAFTLGVGVLPVVALLAVVFTPAGGKGFDRLRAFRWTSAASVVAMLWYVGVKGPNLGRAGLGGLVLERNLIYLTPLAFAALAFFLDRRSVRLLPLAAATVVAYFTVLEAPGRNFPYYESHGLAIMAFAERILHWDAGDIDLALRIVPGAAAALLLLLLAARRSRALGTAASLAVGALVLTWTLTTQVYAAHGEKLFSDFLKGGLPQPFEWVDRATGGDSVVIFGQQIRDPNGVYLTEFWNRSVKKVWSVEGSAPGPGPTQAPDLKEPDGTLTPTPGTEYALTLNGVTLQGEEVLHLGQWVLVRLGGGPLKVSENQLGVDTDGWTGERAAYNRFDVSRDGIGFARVSLRRDFCVDVPLPSTVKVRFGTIAIGGDKQPAIGRELGSRTVEVKPCTRQDVLFPAPTSPWRIEIESETFVPFEVDPRLTERRKLGVQIAFGFQALEQ